MGNFLERIGSHKMNRAHLIDRYFLWHMDVLLACSKPVNNLLFLVK